MLIMKAPIELKTAGFAIGRGDGFGERIRGNYAMMGAHISEQSLTHMLHTPPQILLAEGGGDSITGIQNNVYSFTELQQTLISNVANRILISSDVNLSYQDRVYISNVLHQLGIRDDRRFMEEARTFLEETKMSSRLTDVYLENLPQIKQLINSWQEIRQEAEEEDEEPQRAADTNYLFMNIMKRLQTGAIYQTVQNMSRNNAGDSLSFEEINISEQSYTARQLLLNRFREIAMGESVPMIYRTENSYEEEVLEGGEVSEPVIRERINSAVFLEVLRSFDHTMALRSEKAEKRWMELRNSFYRTADNSLSRILIEAKEGRTPMRLRENSLTLLDRTVTQENSVSEEIRTDTERLSAELTRERSSSYHTDGSSITNIVTEAGEYRVPLQYRDLSLTVLNQAEREELNVLEEIVMNTDRLSTELMNERNSFVEILREELYREGYESDTYSLEELERIREEQRDHSFYSAQRGFLENNREESIENRLERVNEQNSEKLERYREIRRILLEKEERTNRTSDRERTIRESLMSLTDREHLLELLSEEEEETPTAVDRKLQKIYEILPRDTVEILKQIEDAGRGEKGVQAIREPAMLHADLERGAGEQAAAAERAEEQERLRYTEGEDIEEAADRIYRERSREILDRVLRSSGTETVQERIREYLPGEVTEILRQREREAGQQPESIPGRTEDRLQRTAGEAARRGEDYREQELVWHGEEEVIEEVADRVYRERSREILTQLLMDSRANTVLNSYHELITSEFREREERLEERERIMRAVENPAETVYLLNAIAERMPEAPEERIQLRSFTDRRSVVNVIHRIEEQMTEDDVREILEEYRRNESVKQKVTHEAATVTEIRTKEPARVIENAARPMDRVQQEEIEELVERRVRRQLGMISNEVYTRLEKRLRSEKARRGI